MRSDDALRRLESVHLAAQAPLLRELLEQTVRRLELLAPSLSWQRTKDQELVMAVRGALAITRAPLEEILRADLARGQREMNLEAA
jgi:hypothetical protein